MKIHYSRSQRKAYCKYRGILISYDGYFTVGNAIPFVYLDNAASELVSQLSITYSEAKTLLGQITEKFFAPS